VIFQKACVEQENTKLGANHSSKVLNDKKSSTLKMLDFILCRGSSLGILSSAVAPKPSRIILFWSIFIYRRVGTITRHLHQIPYLTPRISTHLVGPVRGPRVAEHCGLNESQIYI
jgi:hypothetical protein